MHESLVGAVTNDYDDDDEAYWKEKETSLQILEWDSYQDQDQDFLTCTYLFSIDKSLFLYFSSVSHHRASH